MEREELIGNMTTAVKIMIITFMPAELVAQYDAGQLATAIVLIGCFIFSIMDAKYPNTMEWFRKDNGKKQEPMMEGILNDEYTCDANDTE